MRVVVFDGEQESISFTGERELVTFDRIEGDATIGTPTITTLTFGAFDPYPRRQTLLHICGSLRKVPHPIEPWKYFSREVVAFSDPDDLRVLRGQDFDLHRAVFRTLFDSLPLQMKSDFVRRHMEQMDTSGDKLMSYSTAATLLVKYVQGHLGEPLALLDRLAQTHASIESKLGQNVPKLSVLMLSDSDGKPVVWLGRTASGSTAIRQSALFTGDQADDSLLGSALQALRDDIQVSRKWNERIF